MNIWMAKMLRADMADRRAGTDLRSTGLRRWKRHARLALVFSLVSLLAPALHAQYSEKDEPKPLVTAEDFSIESQRKDPLAVRRMVIDAELIPSTHQLKAKARIEFQALENTSTASFELNNNLYPTNVTGDDSRPLSARRAPDNLTIEVPLGRTLSKGQSSSITFEYAGELSSDDHSPVEGVRLAYVGEEGSYLLYPGRWFPITGYQLDRYTAELRITVPARFTVVSGGSVGAPQRAGDKAVYSFHFDKPQFPGSIAAVPLEAEAVSAEGLTMKVYFSPDHKAMAHAFGEAAAKMVNFYSDKFGPPPVANLSLVEIDDHSLGGYAGPEVIFLASRAIGTQVNTALLAQEVAQQWWRGLVSPATNADLWIDHGIATYSAALYTEHERGAAVLEDRIRTMSIDALTNDTVPIRAAGRLPDFSPQAHSILYDKAGVVLHMLRWVIGDDAFFNALKKFADQFAFRSATTEDFRKLAEQTSSAKLGPFFLQWMESTGASDFRADYTVYRVPGGYRIAGKIHQDMDTFSMPVEVTIQTDGDPVTQRVEVRGRDSEFSVASKGRPKKVIVDPNDRVLKYNDSIRVQVAVARGEQQVQAHDFQSALDAYQKALDINRISSLVHYRVGEAFYQLRNYQSAANAFREALNGDLVPKWTEVWSHLYLGKIFDVTGQRDRAVNEYQQAVRTKDNTQGAQEQAKLYLEKPYERQSREIESADASSAGSGSSSAAPPAAVPPDASKPSDSKSTDSGSDRPTLRRRN